MAIQQFIQQRTAFWRFLPAVALLLTLALALGLAKPAQAATTTISDRASCEAFGGSVQFSTCEVRADITIAAGDTLVIQFPTEFRQDLINNGTLVVQDRTATDVPALVNNGTINVEDRLSMIQFRNGGVINITGNMTLLSSTSRNMSAGQIYVRNGGNFTIRTGTGFLINDGAITIECGGVMTYVATGLSGNPPQDICPPDVTVNQAAGQADPTNRNPLLFTATFRQAVTGFSETDVILGGTADRSGATVTVSGGPNSYTISVDGVTGNGTVTAAVPADAATDAEGQGNPASTSSDNSITYLSDFTPPSANPSQSPAANGAGWNNSDVTVDWRWSDVNSLDTAQCTTRSTSSGEGVLTLTATCQDIVGNVGTASYTVKVDKTAPTISAAETSSPNANGWYNSNVTIRFTCADATAGLAPTACPADQILSSEGNAVASTARTVTDLAGNTSAASNIVTVKIDKTAPTISAATTGAPNANGWYNSNVTVQFTCNDNLSGVASCPADELLSSEGAAVASTAQSITDLAGNSSAASNVVTVKIDKTAPTISAAATTQPNANGWYNSDVTVQFTCADGLSGVASCPADEVLDSEGAAVASTAQTATDLAGNSSAASNVVTVQIDKTAPIVTVTGVSNNASYTLGSVPAAGCSTTDTLSGVATQATISVTGGNPDGTGSFTATCSGATDNAGNSGSASVTYRVAYNWTGFFQPVDNLPTVNTVNAGQAIPVKFSLGGNYGLNIFAAGYPASQNVSCGSGGGGSSSPIEETVTAGNSSLQYNATNQTYTYVWKTDKAWAGTCRQLLVKLIDGTEHIALFQFNGNGNGRSAGESDTESSEASVQRVFLPLVNQ